MSSEVQSPLHGVTILIAEDSPTQAEKLRHLLEAHECRVLLARNGLEALALAQAHHPTLVITDVVMPQMDGYQLCAAIKADPMLKDIPVVMVTSLTGLQEVARSLESGADNFLRKPYDPTMLISRISYILMNRDNRRINQVRKGAELYLEGRRHFITSDREQIIDLLVSTYEEAIQLNNELQAQQREIAQSNRILRVLYRISEGLMHAATDKEVCTAALQGLTGLPEVRAGWIYLGSPKIGFHCVASRQLPAGVSETDLACGACHCLSMLAESEIGEGGVIVECERLSALGEGWPGQHASVPLRDGKMCLGTMNVVLDGPLRAEGEVMRMLRAVGSEIIIALARVRLLASLAARALDLEAANKELESFSYSISHDLKAPLRAIDGFSGMLARRAEPRLEDEDKRLLTVVRESTKNMSQLIDDLLSFSRLSNAPIAARKIDMMALVQDVYSKLGASGEHHARLVLDDLPPAWGDHNLVRQVWVNLLSNAVKYSSQVADPLIKVAGEVGEGEITYRVCDNGAGFNMRHYDKLFGVFQRLHSSAEFPGTGIGLANVRRIVVRHGGRIWADSKENAGATFFFTLPSTALPLQV